MPNQSGYDVRWFIPIKADVGIGLSVDDVSIGGTDHQTAVKLKAWLVAREWPRGTVFEVRHHARRVTSVRCFAGQISAWRPAERKLPLGSDIELPRSRRSELQIFEAMVERALDFATSRELIDEDTAEEIQREVLQSVLSEAATR